MNIDAWIEEVIRRISQHTLNAIGQRVNTTLPVEVELRPPYYVEWGSLHRVDGPFSLPEIQRMLPRGTVFSGTGRPSEIYFLFSPWPGPMTVSGLFIPMSYIESGNMMINVYNFLDRYARERNTAKVELLLKAGADVTQIGENRKPVLITARESLAETNPTLKAFPDEISRMIIEAKERATLRRRHHALAAFGRPTTVNARHTRRARRISRRRRT
jgi:hypothetical protein